MSVKLSEAADLLWTSLALSPRGHIVSVVIDEFQEDVRFQVLALRRADSDAIELRGYIAVAGAQNICQPTSENKIQLSTSISSMTLGIKLRDLLDFLRYEWDRKELADRFNTVRPG